MKQPKSKRISFKTNLKAGPSTMATGTTASCGCGGGGAPPGNNPPDTGP